MEASCSIFHEAAETSVKTEKKSAFISYEFSFSYVVQAQAQEPGNMVIVKAVVEYRPLSAAGHQVKLAQLPQLVADRRLADGQVGSQVAYAHLALFQGNQDPEPRGVAHRLEKVAQADTLVLRQSILRGPLNPVPVNGPDLAEVLSRYFFPCPHLFPFPYMNICSDITGQTSGLQVFFLSDTMRMERDWTGRAQVCRRKRKSPPAGGVKKSWEYQKG
jgi:hypothetical protein